MSVYLSIGSNVGNRLQNIRTALALLPPKANIIRRSNIYETEPFKVEAQPLFYNLACKVETHLAPADLLKHLQKIESVLGRDARFRGLPRPIDLDILFFDKLTLESDELAIPHPRLGERAFVLVPMNEIAPQLTHPKTGATIAQLLAELPKLSNVWIAKEQL